MPRGAGCTMRIRPTVTTSASTSAKRPGSRACTSTCISSRATTAMRRIRQGAYVACSPRKGWNECAWRTFTGQGERDASDQADGGNTGAGVGVLRRDGERGAAGAGGAVPAGGPAVPLQLVLLPLGRQRFSRSLQDSFELHLHAYRARRGRGGRRLLRYDEDAFRAELCVGEQHAAHCGRALLAERLERHGRRLEVLEERALQPFDHGIEVGRRLALQLLRILRRGLELRAVSSLERLEALAPGVFIDGLRGIRGRHERAQRLPR